MKTKYNHRTTGKFEEGCNNEDYALAHEGMIAVSDGAGGGGLFAEKWSRYLLKKLPHAPIESADDLDGWIGGIWEMFYNSCEQEAKRLGGISLDKFYDEGSFATLVAAWWTANDSCRWMDYGDSVAFHYNRATGRLEHSFGRLGDFDEPPYLINCKDELRKEGFRAGVFRTGGESVVFAASDALSHYIMMMYAASRRDEFADELSEAIGHHSKNENYIKAALGLGKIDFEKDVLEKLMHCIHSRPAFLKYLRGLERQGLLAHDDYSLALMYPKRVRTSPAAVADGMME